MLNIYIGLFLDIQSNVVKVFHIVVPVSIIAGFALEYLICMEIADIGININEKDH